MRDLLARGGITALFEGKVVSNAAWLTGANLIIKPLWFLFLTGVCARVLTASEYGSMLSSLATGAILAVVFEWGTNDVFLKQASIDLSEGLKALRQIISFRLAILTAILLIWVTIRIWLPLPAGILLGFCYALLHRTVELIRTTFRAVDDLRPEALTTMGERVLVISAGIGALVLGASFVGVISAMVAALFISFWLTLAVLRRHPALAKSEISLWPSATHVFGGMRLFAVARFFGAVQVLSVTLNQIGITAIEATQEGPVVAYFGISARIGEMLHLLPTLAVAILWPRIVAAFGREDIADFRRWTLRLVTSTLGLAVIIGIGVAVCAPWILGTLTGKPEYAANAQYLALYGICFPAIALKYVTLVAAMATTSERTVVGWMALFVGIYAVASSVLAHLDLLILIFPSLGVTCLMLALINLHIIRCAR